MPHLDTAVRPAYRPYAVSVGAVRRLSPHFIRVTFVGDDLVHFGTAGLDQRIKVVLPLANLVGGYADFGQDEEAGDWYERWRGLPESERNPFRTYTVRRIDSVARELDVDFVAHRDPGPAGAWAEAATVGDRVIVVGPDERSAQSRIGLDWHPGTARRLLLVGDETAVPAISGILASLDARSDADVFVEVPTALDAVEMAAPAGARVRWIARGDADHGAQLISAVAAWTTENRAVLERAAAPREQHLEDVDVDRDLLWDSPAAGEGEFYAWIAGEAATIKTLRRHLVSDCGVDRRRVAFMGYWRLGQAERAE